MTAYTIPLGLLAAAEPYPVAVLIAKATLLLSVALILSRLARRASASLRHLVAAVTFGVLLLLPLAAALVPAHVVTVARPSATGPAERVERPQAVTVVSGEEPSSEPAPPRPSVKRMRWLPPTRFTSWVWPGWVPRS